MSRAIRIVGGAPRTAARASRSYQAMPSLQVAGIGFGTLLVAAAALWWLVSRRSSGPTASDSQSPVSKELLLAVMPQAAGVADYYLPYMNAAMREGGITTSLRIAAFLAQVAVESDRLRTLEEYADGSAYEGRRDLGNIYPGDGVRYKGRGALQLTGRSNYHNAGSAIGVDIESNPELAADPSVAFRTAVWVWSRFHLNDYADSMEFDAITRAINCGSPTSGCSPNGVSLRNSYYNTALSVLGEA